MKPATKSSAPPATEEPNRRAELIRAAGRLFREQGYAATTVRDIAAAVGMRSGSPFYHFKSKQEMLKAVVLEGMQAALAGFSGSGGKVSGEIFCDWLTASEHHPQRGLAAVEVPSFEPGSLPDQGKTGHHWLIKVELD